MTNSHEESTASSSGGSHQTLYILKRNLTVLKAGTRPVRSDGSDRCSRLDHSEPINLMESGAICTEAERKAVGCLEAPLPKSWPGRHIGGRLNKVRDPPLSGSRDGPLLEVSLGEIGS